MLSTRHRFHGYNSLRHVYRHGQTVRGPLFAVKYQLNPKRQDYRAAIVISRKVSKSAVNRNRIRRRLYETLRQLNISQPYDIVLNVFHDSVRETSAKELTHLVKKQLRQAGILTKK